MKSATAILIAFCITHVAKAYPTVSMSFRALGTISVTAEGTNKKYVMINFEENYQRTPYNRSAISFTEGGKKSTIIDHIEELQTFLYDDQGCRSFGPSDVKIEGGLRLLKSEFSGQYIFTLKQLFNLDTKYLKLATPDNVVVQGAVTINRYNFFINDSTAQIIITADWTTEATKTASKILEVPKTFTIESTITDEVTKKQAKFTQVINVEAFTHGEYNSHVFRPRRGVYCPGRKDPNKFEWQVVKKLKTLHTKVESVVKQYSKTGVIDTWFDPENKLYRINYAPISRFIKNGIQKIVSHVQGVIYEIRDARKCTVEHIEKVKNEFDAETIFNPLTAENFDMAAYFGTENANYVSIGEVVERGIPCTLYQGLRDDWPPNHKGEIETVWEWCLANQGDLAESEVKFQLNGFPLVSLNIYVSKSTLRQTESPYVQGLRLDYNFYDVKNHTQEYLDNLAFDIKQCFEESNQKRLIFQAKVAEHLRKIIEKNDRQLELVAAWKAAICKAAGIEPGSLRISNVQTRLDMDLNVTFTLLGRHPDLPDPSAEVSLEVATKNLETSLNNGEIAVKVDLPYEGKTEPITLKGEPGSLMAKVVQEDPINGKPKTGISGATMAAVAVVMLALGLAVGAAVVFIKRRAKYQRI